MFHSPRSGHEAAGPLITTAPANMSLDCVTRRSDHPADLVARPGPRAVDRDVVLLVRDRERAERLAVVGVGEPRERDRVREHPVLHQLHVAVRQGCRAPFAGSPRRARVGPSPSRRGTLLGLPRCCSPGTHCPSRAPAPSARGSKSLPAVHRTLVRTTSVPRRGRCHTRPIEPAEAPSQCVFERWLSPPSSSR